MSTSPLRVAIVAPSLGILGGHSVQAEGLIRAWRNDPDVYAWLVPINPTPPALLRWTRGVKYLRTVVNELMFLPLLVRELAHADVVHVFSASYTSFLLAPLPATMVAHALGRPVVLNYHSGEAPDHLRRSAIARRAMAGAASNVVPSRFLVDVLQQFGIQATEIANIVDLTRFRFRARDPLAPRLLSTRNLGYPYNVACTLRAFEIIQREVPEASLTLVGSGPDEPRLREMTNTLRLRNVTFAGRVSPEAIADYYASHDIYIQSPDIDNMPISVIEAFASGLPVVSTNAGGVPVLLAGGERGLLGPINDHAALANNVIRLLTEPGLGRQLAERAQASCAAFSWGAVRDQWLRVYRGVASRAPSRQAPPASSRSRADASAYETAGVEK
jgi:glycosyltransferase involved in cell wall biosynthesis